MNAKNILTLTVAAALSLTSCKKDFEDFERNPNKPVSVPPNLIFTGVADALNQDKPFGLQARWSQFDICNYNYYGDQRYDWTGATLNFLTLKNVIKMEEEGKRLGLPEVNEYTALGKFFRAFFYYRMTNLVGDLPLEAALKGTEDAEPAYDSQKAAFIQILAWLDEANNDLAAVISASGDARIDGDFYFTTKTAWRKVINAFRLRALIDLSARSSDADLGVSSSFAAILNDGAKYPLFAGSADNLQFLYSNINKYPINPDNLGLDATRYNASATYLNNLVQLKDPRAFITAEPATKQLKSGKTPADITAYNGAPSGEDLAEMSSKMSDVENAEYSLRSRSTFYSSYAAEPGIIVGYPEMCFNIAEAINRGWATGNAEEWYKKGIKASLAAYRVPVDAPGNVTKVYPYNSTSSVTYSIPFDFEGVYYQQPSIKYPGNTEDGLEKILLQKYLAFFNNSGWEAYFNWRRTGIPDFSIGTGTGNSGRIPLRFRYPDTEQIYNKESWTQAVESQFGGNDDINGKIWLIKE